MVNWFPHTDFIYLRTYIGTFIWQPKSNILKKWIRIFVTEYTLFWIYVFRRVCAGNFSISTFIVPPFVDWSRILHLYVIIIPADRTKLFASSFLIPTLKEWNTLPATVFPEKRIRAFQSFLSIFRHIIA